MIDSDIGKKPSSDEGGFGSVGSMSSRGYDLFRATRTYLKMLEHFYVIAIADTANVGSYFQKYPAVPEGLFEFRFRRDTQIANVVLSNNDSPLTVDTTIVSLAFSFCGVGIHMVLLSIIDDFRLRLPYYTILVLSESVGILKIKNFLRTMTKTAGTFSLPFSS